MDRGLLADDAEGAAPPELLGETELASGLLATHRIPVDRPFAEYLEDGEQPHHVVPTGEVTESGSYLYYGGSNAQHGIAVLTDRRVLVAVGDDDPPLSIRYEDVTRVGFGSSGMMSHDPIQVVCSEATYEFDYGEIGKKLVTDAIEDADGEVLDRQGVVDWIDETVSERNARRELVSDLLEEVNANLDHRNAMDGPVTDAGMTALLDAHEAAVEIAENADGIDAVDRPDADDRVADLEVIVEARFEQWVEAVRDDLSSGRLAAAAEDAVAARELLDGAPLSDGVRTELERSLYDAELRARTLASDDDAALALVRECLGGGGPPVDDRVAFVVDALAAAADRDEVAVATQVTGFVPALGERRGSSLPAVVGRLADRRPKLVAGASPTAAAGLLRHDDGAVREVACDLLAVVGTADELDALRDCEDDEVYDVRVAAMEAMKAIAEREDVALGDADRERLREVNITYEGSGDVVAGDYADHSTAVEDSVVNRSAIGEGADAGEPGDETAANGGGPSFCPSCGSDFGDYDDPAFCPDCGFDL